jgi:hypothetical protein
MYCNYIVSHNGGRFGCCRGKKHPGIHLAESGDGSDFYVGPKAAIVKSVGQSMKLARLIFPAPTPDAGEAK